MEPMTRPQAQTIHYKPTGEVGLFDTQEKLDKLAALGNPLQRLAEVVDFEMFRPRLEAAMLNTERKSAAGARPYDVVLLFKTVLLKRLYHLSDEQAEYQTNDRLSFREFLGLSSGDRVPDSRTIWAFQERLGRLRLEEELFELFKSHLCALGLLVNEGRIVDASFVEVPRQRNTRQENEAIKAGQGAQLWTGQPRKRSQKDTDARWTKKNNTTHYGYKDHAKIDSASKLIVSYEATSAEVHDSQKLDALTGEEDRNQPLHADSAYASEESEKMLKGKGITAQINERAYRNKPLTDEQKAANKVKSKTRARVEHTFGFITNSMNGFFLRTIGLPRARCAIGLINLAYNMCRLEQIVRLKLLPLKELAPA